MANLTLYTNHANEKREINITRDPNEKHEQSVRERKRKYLYPEIICAIKTGIPTKTAEKSTDLRFTDLMAIRTEITREMKKRI